MLKIFITNLGKYNEGSLVGEWADLDDFESLEDLEESGFFKKIGIGSPRWDGGVYEEYFVTDYETDIPELDYSEYPNIDELIKLESRWEDLAEDGKLAVRAYLKEKGNRLFEDAFEMAENGDYSIYRDCLDKTTVMKYWYGDDLILRDLPKKYEGFIDWKEVANEYGGNLHHYDFQTFVELPD